MGFKDAFNDIPIIGSLFSRTEDSISNEIFREAEIDDQLRRTEPVLRLNQQVMQENMSYQNDLAKEMFDYEADYNTPLHQRERNAAAGLNENWVDGTGLIQGGLGATPSMSSSGDTSSDSKLQRQLQREQLSNARRQTDLNQDMQKQQIELIKDQQQTEKSKQNLNDKQADWYNTDAAGKEIDNIYKSPHHTANIAEINANAEKLRNDKKWQDALGDQNIKESNERINKLIAEQDNLDAVTKQVNEMLPLLKNKTDAETAELYAKAKAEEMGAQAAVYNAETNRLQVGINARMIDEVKRHNLASEKLQDYINKAQKGLWRKLGKLYDNQSELVHKNEIMAEIQGELMHYAKANGIPQSLMLLQLDYAREKLYHESEQRQYTREQAENLSMQTILLPVTSVSGITNDAFSNINAHKRFDFDLEKWNHDKDGWSRIIENYNAEGNRTGSILIDHRPN